MSAVRLAVGSASPGAREGQAMQGLLSKAGMHALTSRRREEAIEVGGRRIRRGSRRQQPQGNGGHRCAASSAHGPALHNLLAFIRVFGLASHLNHRSRSRAIPGVSEALEGQI